MLLLAAHALERRLEIAHAPGCRRRVHLGAALAAAPCCAALWLWTYLALLRQVGRADLDELRRGLVARPRCVSRSSAELGLLLLRGRGGLRGG